MSKVEIAFGIVILTLLVVGYAIPEIAGVENRPFALFFSENFTADAYDTPIQLTHTNLSNWEVYNSTLTFQDETDYTIDATPGSITVFSSGNMQNNSTYTIDYYHDEDLYTGRNETLVSMLPFIIFIGIILLIGIFFFGVYNVL